MISRRPRVPLYGVAVCAALFVVLLVVAYASPAARQFDGSALQGFSAISNAHGEPVVARIASLGDAAPVALMALALAAIALLRGRPRIAVSVLFLVAATSVSGQLLKALLAYPRSVGDHAVGPDAFPSGHSTAAMTLALCLVLVVPARLRPLAGIVGLSFALAVGFGVVSLSWHFPSDVVGGYLLATAWTLAVVSGLLWLEQRRPERSGPLAATGRAVVDRVAAVGLVTVVVVGAALVALASGLVLVTRRPDIPGFLSSHSAAALVAPVIVAAGAALLLAVTLFLRRSE